MTAFCCCAWIELAVEASRSADRPVTMNTETSAMSSAKIPMETRSSTSVNPRSLPSVGSSGRKALATTMRDIDPAPPYSVAEWERSTRHRRSRRSRFETLPPPRSLGLA